jgi:acyl-CoA synthetase (NDP forming)/GNAT superfamily N-acetyltransferase
MAIGRRSASEQGAHALLADGAMIQIRAVRQEDYDAVRDMHASMSADNLYLRFFTVSKLAPESEARRICREPAPDHAALLAVLDGAVIGCGSFDRAGDDPGSAEIALAVADGMHRRGVGTLLLEHLVSLARGRGIRAFTAQTLTENTPMLHVFANAGLPVGRALAGGVYDLSFPLPGGETDIALGAYRDAVAGRERSAGVASLRHVLAPASVAVIGASRDPRSAGAAILRNIVTGGFGGPVYVVSPSLAELDGVPCLPSVAALPDQVDLAVIAAPAAAVPGIAEECGRRGVRALAVVTSRLDSTARAGLMGICRRHGMRLVGPGSAGVANARISLNATLAARHPRPGMASVALQSGEVEVALLERLSRLGIGISSFISLGYNDDVSGHDMLQWWASDPKTKLAIVYQDSFGNPCKFARTARRAARIMPIVTVNAARSAAGQRLMAAGAAASPAPAQADSAPASCQLLRQALFEQAGVIATASLGDLLECAALLASQPVPAGNRVAVVSSAVGAGVLAVDACGDGGLQVATLTGPTRAALRGLLPARATVAGPVVTTTAIAPGIFRRCLELAGADPGVDAVLALTAIATPIELASQVYAARLEVPIAAVVLDQAEAVRLLPGPGENTPAVPAYAYPESAARALAYAVRYGTRRATPPEPVPDLDGVRQDLAERLVGRFLAGAPAGGWLPAKITTELLGCYGIPLGSNAKATGDAAGAEVSIGVLHEQVFGPLVLFGAGGAAAGATSGRSVRLAPLTSRDARELVCSVPGVPRLRGRPGAPVAGAPALEDMLLRVSRLADDLPQITELELSPVIACPDGVRATGALARVQAAEPSDAFLRRLG